MHPKSGSLVTARVSRFAHVPLVGDVIVTVIAFGLTLALLAHGGGASRGLDPLGVVLAAISTFPLLAHRRAPLTVLSVTTAAHVIINGLGYVLGPPFGATIALFYVAADERTRARPRETAIVLVGIFAVHVGVTAIVRGSPAVPILSAIIVWGGVWIVGDQVRQRRQRRAELEERARRAERDLERERRLAAAEERTRIARDLHDSAAHAINVILVQAGAARLLQRRDPDAAEDALTTIEDVARETIGEIDQLVYSLRENGSAQTAEDAFEPPTGLAAVQSLAERHRAAGQEIRITIAGRPRGLAPGLDQAAYRILQESLTNAARHGSGPAEVEIVYRDDELELSVSNPVQITSNGQRADGGHGILGMRERAALLGGSLQTGRHDTAFRVDAHLPYATPSER
jgi:signal transduction histidine kinase